MEIEFVFRLLVAAVLGAMIGLEREYRAKEAGYRTHFLVALGSALLMIISKYGFSDVLSENLVRLDPSRIASQVVTGIGFIGAGTIIFQKHVVRGLTTAAGIWATAGIGLAIGAGMYMLGIVASFLVLAGLELLRIIFKNIGLRSVIVEFSTTQKSTLIQVTSMFQSEDYHVVSYEMTQQGAIHLVSMVVKFKTKNDEGILLNRLQAFPDLMVQRIE
ncbi:MAG: MgtC/SapB family protein [Bacteroidaceae bacterium]